MNPASRGTRSARGRAAIRTRRSSAAVHHERQRFPPALDAPASLSARDLDHHERECSTSPSDVLSQMLTGQRRFAGDEFGGRSGEDDLAAVVACTGTEVDHPVGSAITA